LVIGAALFVPHVPQRGDTRGKNPRGPSGGVAGRLDPAPATVRLDTGLTCKKQPYPSKLRTSRQNGKL
jgi:hypothetical protein